MRDLEWLQDSFHAVDRVFFGDRLQDTTRITWMRSRRRKKWMVFGLWSPGLIEINPVLAYDWVPDLVVMRYIYHECLHANFDSIEHDTKFTLAERQYPNFSECEVWVSENIDRLLETHAPRGLKRV